MSENRELLELAAKAAGVEGEYVCWCLNGFKEGIRKPSDTTSIPWNPITDDGPALRLAVKLEILVLTARGFAVANAVDSGGTCVRLLSEPDPYAATRRAIVKAAAEIGRAMP